MNIDQRLEALTQSVELLASFHRDIEIALKKQSEDLNAKLDKLAAIVAPIAQLVLDHEHRLNRLEGS